MCNNVAGEDSNVLDAAVNGATQSVFLIGNIAASLVAFLAFIAFLNGVLGWLGALLGFPGSASKSSIRSKSEGS